MPLSQHFRNPYSNSTAPALQTNPDSYIIKEALVSKLEIHLSCANLKDKDYLSKSDPMVVAFVEIPKADKRIWQEYDRTETVKNDLNPVFIKPIIIEYYFEVYQRLKFEVYDKDSTSTVLNKHDFLGAVEVSMGSIIGESGGPVTKSLYSRNKERLESTISFVSEEMFDTKEILTVQFKGQRLDRKDLFSNSDPFLVISRCSLEQDTFLPVYKTETIKNNNNPTWDQFQIPVTTLCNGDRDRTIRIECFDAGSKRTLIGSCDTSINALVSDPKQKLILFHKKKKQNKDGKKTSGSSGKQAGQLKIQHIEINSKSSFLDYISAGLELSFHVAVDFTASNGNIALPSSLHYQGETNQYAEALWNVGRICEDYDTDKLIPAYGFGAKVNGQISHDFHLNFSQDPNCEGIAGVLDAYQNSVNAVEFFGPTNFAPIVNKVSDIAESQQTYGIYHILLILTDGMISDMGLTKKALVRASQLPISVIIVGVGNGNFDSMVELDGDDGLLMFQDQTAERDIVQFVSYQSFSGCFAAVDLAQEVLYEVPHQLTIFMEKRGISPGDDYTLQMVDGEDGFPVEFSDDEDGADDDISSIVSATNITAKASKKNKRYNEIKAQYGTLLPGSPGSPFIRKEPSAKEHALRVLQRNSERNS